MIPDKSIGPLVQAVKGFVRDELSYGADESISFEADLIEQGVIDSMSLLRLVAFLEERFQIEVRDEDLVPENFRSFAAIEAFVKRSKAAD